MNVQQAALDEARFSKAYFISVYVGLKRHYTFSQPLDIPWGRLTTSPAQQQRFLGYTSAALLASTQ